MIRATTSWTFLWRAGRSRVRFTSCRWSRDDKLSSGNVIDAGTPRTAPQIHCLSTSNHCAGLFSHSELLFRPGKLYQYAFRYYLNVSMQALRPPEFWMHNKELIEARWAPIVTVHTPVIVPIRTTKPAPELILELSGAFQPVNSPLQYDCTLQVSASTFLIGSSHCIRVDTGTFLKLTHLPSKPFLRGTKLAGKVYPVSTMCKHNIIWA